MNNSFNVIHSYPIWLPQTQTWMYNQVKYLPQSIRVDVVCEVTENLDQFGLPNLHSLGEKSKILQNIEKGLRHYSIRTKIGYLSKLAKQLNTQIIHSHFGNIGWNNQKKVDGLGIKHVVTFYGWDVTMLPAQDGKWFNRYKDLFTKADRFLCEGPYMASSLVKMGCDPKKIIVHHLGVETEKLIYMPRKFNNGDTLRVLIAASFVEKKGIPYALLALSQIANRVPLEVTIIGDANSSIKDTSEKKLILQTINDSGLVDKVRLLGYQPSSILFSEAYKHHIFISPSITASDGNTEGGAPVSIIEMMATGMPVVSTTHCDIPEVIQYDINDWLVAEKDIPGLVNRINWLIENPEKWGGFLEFGRKHIESKYNAIKQGENLAEIYQQVV